ncbi:hypothetical protein F5148DRAFT_1161453 [Russula earlei]|uniref:Uncharacterized protein n=1 Tax=Russula earlei TaxID=71964 RepID=A0ACC0UMG1_9AGAM|nr:hypothetical protein F5148DRAFT_1161453 [Russula earlei]
MSPGLGLHRALAPAVITFRLVSPSSPPRPYSRTCSGTILIPRFSIRLPCVSLFLSLPCASWLFPLRLISSMMGSRTYASWLRTTLLNNVLSALVSCSLLFTAGPYNRAL